MEQHKVDFYMFLRLPSSEGTVGLHCNSGSMRIADFKIGLNIILVSRSYFNFRILSVFSELDNPENMAVDDELSNYVSFICYTVRRIYSSWSLYRPIYNHDFHCVFCFIRHSCALCVKNPRYARDSQCSRLNWEADAREIMTGSSDQTRNWMAYIRISESVLRKILSHQ